MEFRGVDIVIEKAASDAALRAAVSRGLGVPVDRIVVINDITKYPAKDQAEVVCVVSPVSGHFALLLSVQSDPIQVDVTTPFEFVQEVANDLQMKCLTPDLGDNPYLMWLIEPRSSPQRVAMDTDALDRGVYVVKRVVS